MRCVLLLFLSLVFLSGLVYPAVWMSSNSHDDIETTAFVSHDTPPDGDLSKIPSPLEGLKTTEATFNLDVSTDAERLDTVEEKHGPGGLPFVTMAARSIVSCLEQVATYAARILMRDGLGDSWFRVFVFLFLFRYVRLVVHVVAYSRFKAKPVLARPTFTAQDVTVIIPTVEPRGAAFEECLDRVLANSPAEIFIVTVGEENIRTATSYCRALSSSIRILSVAAPSKREQVKRAVQETTTAITVLCDDTVFWPETFLPHVLAPFEDPLVGIVGTCKRVRRAAGRFGLADFWNLCGVMRLERTNFDLAATNAVDGGVSCVSGRTCAVRSAILQDPAFLHAYTHEYIFWLRTPLNAGDDKFLSRWVMRQGWRVFHQSCAEARIETILGVKGGGQRFRGQCLRWARSSARDNPKMLVADGLWRRYPWTAYAVLATSLVNYAALYDPALVLALRAALANPATRALLGGCDVLPLAVLCLWILATKFVRPASHYWRNPRDLVYAPFVILFGYYHSWIKLHALVTCWDISWGTRAGVDAAQKAPKAH
ncbi:Capsule polysaccharide synthase [Neofusicoccum parvum]|nr:Capsule polysaccharide synthase [Neofusicoccum parvum]